MYKLPYYIEKDESIIMDFLQKNSFTILSGVLNGRPVATHVPLEIKKENDQLIFTGHMMKGTDHYNAFLQNENVLSIFSGPHCYVSASWYEYKQKGSTWNYMDVQAQGKLQFTDEEGTRRIVESVTNKYEGTESEAAFSKLSEEYIQRNVKAISGFHILVEKLDAVFKLSQNESEQTQQQIIDHLLRSEEYMQIQIAHEMQKRLYK